MIDLSYILEKLMLILFFTSNIVIIWQDIRHRKIKNIQLLSLILILPLWIYVYNITLDEFINHILISGLLFLGGIIFYKHDGFIGAGDIKYIAILIFFLSDQLIKVLIGNIGVLTLGVLLFWWSTLSGVIYALRIYIPKYGIIPELKSRGEKMTIIKSGLLLILDWIVLGYVIKEFLQFILLATYGVGELSGDMYFLLGIGIFLLRGPLRLYLFEGTYKNYGIVTLSIFFLYKIQELGFRMFWIQFYDFVGQIWIYALIFTCVYIITHRTFKLYDTIMTTVTGENNSYKTIPYSVILFLGFIVTNYTGISLIEIVRGGL